MAVTKTEYGNWYTLEGTLAEVMAELKGKSPDEVISVVYDGTDYTVICVHRTPKYKS